MHRTPKINRKSRELFTTSKELQILVYTSPECPKLNFWATRMSIGLDLSRLTARRMATLFLGGNLISWGEKKKKTVYHCPLKL